MDRLYTALPAFGTRCASPFGTKALTLMRLSGRAFERVDARPDRGPRGKLPWLESEGQLIADTRNIHDHLASLGLVLPVGAHDVLALRTIEESLYWAQVYFRWTYHEAEVREALFGELPWPMLPLVFALVRRQVRAALRLQGTGRRPEAELLALVHADFDALERLLGDDRFFAGASPGLADVSLHGLLEQLLPTTFDDPLVRLARSRARMVTLHADVDAHLAERGERTESPCSTRC